MSALGFPEFCYQRRFTLGWHLGGCDVTRPTSTIEPPSQNKDMAQTRKLAEVRRTYKKAAGTCNTIQHTAELVITGLTG